MEDFDDGDSAGMCVYVVEVEGEEEVRAWF